MHAESLNIDDDVEIIDFGQRRLGRNPERILRKINSIPYLEQLEQMFDESSSGDDTDASTTNTSFSRRARRAYSDDESIAESNSRSRLSSDDDDSMEFEPYVIPQRPRIHNPTHTVTSNTLSQNIPIDLTDDADDNNTHQRATNNTETLPNTHADNNSTILMEEILKKALLSLQHINKSKRTSTITSQRLANPGMILLHTNTETPVTNINGTVPRNIEITHDVRDVQDHGTCVYIQTTDSGNKKDKDTQTERYQVQQVDRVTCNVTKNIRRNPRCNSNNPVYVCNIAYMNKCSDPKSKSEDKDASKSSKEDKSATKEKQFGDCPVCMDKLDGSNVTSAFCGHIFCLRCITYIYTKGDKKCPTCRTVLQNPGFHKLYL